MHTSRESTKYTDRVHHYYHVANGTPGGSEHRFGASVPSAGTHNAPTLPGSTITIHSSLRSPIMCGRRVRQIPSRGISRRITGEIDLVNASTKQFIGIILAETGPKQTSYTWNAEQVYLGRYSADEKAVIPGTYSIRIHFDGMASAIW